jgi:hypothetical protein
MSLVDMFLGRQNVQQLPPEQQQQARSEATRQFLLGTLFGGRGLASGYAATQEVIPSIRAAQQQQRVNQAIQQSTVPQGTGLTQFGPGSQGGMLLGELQGFENDPAAAAMIDEAAMRNPNIPRVFDPSAFARNIAPVLAGSAPKTALEIAQMSAPVSAEGGLQTNRFTGQITGSLPTTRDNIQTQFNTATGRFQAVPVLGGRAAAEAVRPTAVETGQQINNGIVQTAPGYVPSLTEITAARTAAEEAAKAQFDLVDVTGPDGTVYRVKRSSLLGQQPGVPTQIGQTGTTPPIAQLSPAQIAVNEQFPKVIESARIASETASRRRGTIDQLRNALNNPNFETGAFTQQKAALTNALSALGITGDKANSYLISATSFRQGVNDLTMGSLAELVGAISNFEIDFSQKRFGTITDPVEANRYALDILEAGDKRKTDYYNFLAKNPRPDAPQLWAQSPEGQRSLFEDPKLLKWLPQRVIPSGPDKGKTAYQLPSGEFVVKD